MPPLCSTAADCRRAIRGVSLYDCLLLSAAERCAPEACTADATMYMYTWSSFKWPFYRTRSHELRRLPSSPHGAALSRKRQRRRRRGRVWRAGDSMPGRGTAQ
eukprot:TRINITY_DN25494_c0_g1_i1.p1 TRINITY_DN25494_c0_g1~~TRINITY_DN25494_c0_g1_i1.p1  ORF type:complete len:103 (+),score=7.12 TRINITY_DN25494_c0_g1_i1:201-509(+)